MSATYTLNIATDLYVLECCNCGVLFGFPLDYEKRRRDDHAWFYCPSGHQQHYSGKSDAEKLRERKAELERLLASAREDTRAERMRADEEKRKHAATKATLTKTRKRAENGVCLHCHRHFVDVQRHVARQHPEQVSS